MSFEIKGLKEAQDKLRKLSEDAKSLNGQSVPLTEVMTDSFISEHSSFSSFRELIDASGFKFESQEDFDAIPDDNWDEFAGSQAPAWEPSRGSSSFPSTINRQRGKPCLEAAIASNATLVLTS